MVEPVKVGASTQPTPWYVCLTKPRQERFAQERLLEQGYQVYLPFLCSWQQRAGRWQRTESIMFPRYAFVRPGMVTQSITAVRSTPGVSSLVRFGPVLGCLAPDRLDALRNLVDVQATVMPSQPLEAGAGVMFSSGPLKGMAGLVSSASSQRVMVMFSLLGRVKLVAVSVDQLILV